MHPRCLSNAYVVGDKRGGTAVFVDSGAPLTPLLTFIGQQGLSPTARAAHARARRSRRARGGDRPAGRQRVVRRSTGLQIEAIPTPGHSDDMVCFVIRDEWGEEYVFSGDTLFKNSIGGGNFEQIKTRRDGRLHGDAEDAPRACRATPT